MKTISQWVFFSVLGWKLHGAFPKKLKKYVVIVYPHTSWVDFPIAILIKYITGINAAFVGKKSLFKRPIGWFFRYYGGIPIDRTKNHAMVNTVVEKFNENEHFIFSLSPEGTRRKTDRWKTGFYYIAKLANVPVVKVALNYEKKEIFIDTPYELNGDIDVDMKKIQQFFVHAKGLNPQQDSTLSYLDS
ncbi:1-acyl-sn-glycerol-3-phosphate acyltransferase [Flavicella sediminum]|uniref:1-acyl-sn-glycerol-3-phosphate acyltransferase n=1 Tax=Flavicella sediminum TaxID=2585141 RepID=UPI001122C4AA|nr:1-acyl-sn-glycerol-3-phosphate acyltransferase [Flavicella sediminum]